MANEHNEIILTGLKGSHPLSALAAFGLLRWCTEITELQYPRLRWHHGDDWVAVLTTDNPIHSDELIRLLANSLSRPDERIEFDWGADDIKTSPEDFRNAAQKVVNAATPSERRAADFFAAYANELIHKDGSLKPTAFHMLSGQQTFFKKGLRELASSLAIEVKVPAAHDDENAEPKTSHRNAKNRSTEEMRRKRKEKTQVSLHEALFGPWLYQDSEHPMGWDSSTERLYALRAKDPSPDKKNRSVKAAVWLAGEALPLFPCAVVGNKLVTRGFGEKPVERSRNIVYFSWPLWSPPLTIEAVRSLLALKVLTLDQPPLAELRARGIVEVFRSYRTKTGGDSGDYKIFRAAQPCIGGDKNGSS
jgi:hypothetical protein